MKKWILVLLVILFLVVLFPLSNGTPERSNFEVTSIIIDFEKTNAIVTVNYEFPKIMKMYILLLGSKDIEPKINEMFSEFDYRILKINPDKAIVSVTNVSRIESGFYIHDSRKFGNSIKTIIIYTPDSPRPIQYINRNLNATPDIFYRT